MQQVNLGMIGGGTVGSGVYHAWSRNGDLLAARLGVKITFRKIAVRSLAKDRTNEIPRALLTTDWQEVVHDPQIHHRGDYLKVVLDPVVRLAHGELELVV